ncbi:MAG: dual specificity protein phosphatase [Planctomycetota bacterium]|nr:dual specificity protein phosphatase [Planctomycetota bacterium]
MNWITDRIAIGNHLDALDVELIRQHAFRSALSLDGTLASGHAAKLGLEQVVAYELIDGAGNSMRAFQSAVRDLGRLAESHSPVLVQCHAGRSRSAVVVAAYLTTVSPMGPDEAIAAVAAKREINITPDLVDLLRRWMSS